VKRNSSADRREVVTNVRDLVQRLIDDRITAQVFTERLQTELQSSPQVLTAIKTRLDEIVI
jgi:hypothetical protein